MEGLDERRARFTGAFEELSPKVFAYVRRHCDCASAQDVVADVFLVAWRRWSDVPEPALPWLLVVARNTLANRQRGAARQQRLAQTIGRLEAVAGHAAAADAGPLERQAVLAALAELSEAEREALLLVGWDGLTNRQAAVVAGCSARAFEVRLSRARARMNRVLAGQPPRRSEADEAMTGTGRRSL